MELAERLISSGVQAHHVMNAFYLTSRNAYHFGFIWKASRRRFHPLYSTAAIKAAHALSEQNRRANRLGFDLMMRFSRDLAMLPFADKSWSPRLMPNAPPPITSSSPRLGDPNEQPVALYRGKTGASHKKVDPIERRLRQQGVKSSFARSIPLIDGYRGLTPPPSLDPLADVFDVSVVREFMRQEPEALAVPPNVVTNVRLMAACLWANDLEIAPGDAVQ